MLYETTPQLGDSLAPDYLEAAVSASTVSDESVDTNVAIPSRTRPLREQKLAQAEQAVFRTVEERVLFATLAKSQCAYTICKIGAWSPEDPEYYDDSEILSAHNQLTAQNVLRHRISFTPMAVDTEPNSPINSSEDNCPAESSQKHTECASPASEPSLVSDYASTDEKTIYSPTSDTTTPLEKLALLIFRFWPAGVSIYSGQTFTAHPSGSDENGASSNYSHERQEKPGQAADASNHHSQTNVTSQLKQEGTRNQVPKLSRSIKRSAAQGDPIPQHRCLVEAGRNDESCVGITNFNDMPRHLEHRHAQIYERTLYHDKTLSQHFQNLKIRLKQNTDEACETFAVTLFTIMYPDRFVPYLRFDLLPGGGRRCHDPPTAPALNLFPANILPMPVTGGRESNLIEQDLVHTPRPTSPCSSHTATEAGFGCSKRSGAPSRKQTAASNFAAEMKSNPLLALRARRIANEINTHEQDAQLERIKIEFQLGSKRKELEVDIAASSSASDQPIKRARYLESHNEAVAKLKAIDTKLRQSYDEAEQKMQDLYGARNEGEGTSLPAKDHLHKQEPVGPGPQPVIASTDEPDGLDSSEHMVPLDFNLREQGFLSEDDYGFLPNVFP